MPLKTLVDEQPTMNLTSMIDVLFLLIIFFMVSTKFSDLEERKIAVKVPAVSEGGALTPAMAKRVVHVQRDGTIYLDDQAVTLAQLVDRLAAARSHHADLGVLVRGDGEGQFQAVAQVLNAVRRAGIKEMGVSVRTGEAGM